MSYTIVHDYPVPVDEHGSVKVLPNLRDQVGSKVTKIVCCIRLEEVVLARLKIGHTRITYSSLLNKEKQLQCYLNGLSFLM